MSVNVFFFLFLTVVFRNIHNTTLLLSRQPWLQFPLFDDVRIHCPGHCLAGRKRHLSTTKSLAFRLPFEPVKWEQSCSTSQFFLNSKQLRGVRRKERAENPAQNKELLWFTTTHGVNLRMKQEEIMHGVRMRRFPSVHDLLLLNSMLFIRISNVNAGILACTVCCCFQ